ncbi:MAG TPA: fluoride efflux transporter CrcB [Victivallales bacterium]|nr:fluoride efflux transporter CrcB [Victivallales bacterium]
MKKRDIVKLKLLLFQSLIVGIGGILGAISRYLLEWLVKMITGAVLFPFGTLTVNMLGCLLIGMMFALIDGYSSVGPRVRLFFITGYLGALTTFSSFGLDTFKLMISDHFTVAVFNILIQIVVGLFAVWLGYVVIRLIGRIIRV